MNRFPFKDRHRSVAEGLYKHRCRLVVRGVCDASALITLEERLAAHLHALARLGEQKLDGKGRDPSRFVDFAVALQSADPSEIDTACRLAVEQLSDPAVSAEPILDAFTFYPPDNARLMEHYRALPQAGARLFTLWRRQQAKLPMGLLNQAELQTQDEELQYRTLAYAADHPAYGADLFRVYYSDLLDKAQRTKLPERLLIPTLRGGLLRGDPEAPQALRRALSLVEDPGVRQRLLRLLALHGDRTDLPVLLQYHRQSPAQGLHLLALTGLVETIPTLIDSLGDPALSDEGARAWTWLTGVTLPRRPHLMLVDDKGDKQPMASHNEKPLRQVPDRSTAEAWWQTQAPVWGDERRIQGAPLDVGQLIPMAKDRVGETAMDLLDLLAHQLRRPLGIAPWGWSVLRRQRLDDLDEAVSASQDARRQA